MDLKPQGSGPILCFGEILFRISPDTRGEWLEDSQVPLFLGGAELNVARNLALWDIPCRYFTAMPDNPISQEILHHLRRKNLDTEKIALWGNRMGLFYLSQGEDMKHSALVYDRAGSSFSELKTGQIDWTQVLEGVSWVHFSAICPGISQETAHLCEEMLMEASRLRIPVSLDLNFRSLLWKYGKEPLQVIPGLASYCDLLMGNIWSFEKMLVSGNILDMGTLPSREILIQKAEEQANEILSRFPKIKALANTFRMEGENLEYFGTLVSRENNLASPSYFSDFLVDKVGSGDCFMAGLLYGLYHGYSFRKVLEFATVAAFDKLFLWGDSTSHKPDKILERMNKQA